MTLLCLAVTGAWADNYTMPLTSFTKTGTTYEYTFSELKCKNYTNILVEVPSAIVSGTVSWKGSGANSSRFLYIYKTNGTVKDETRKIEFKKSYESVNYTSDDIMTSDGKYYLVFGTTDDYKAVGVQYTVPAATTAFTVTFEAGDDGTCTTASLTEESAGSGITLPTVTNVTAGYAFKGWYTAATGGTLAGVAGATYYPTENLTLYAQYVEVEPYATPTITEKNGTVQITTTDAVDGMQIKYSTDGGTTYNNYTIPFNLSEAATVKAYVTGTSQSYTNSEVAETECASIPAAKTGSQSIALYYDTNNFTRSSGESGSKNDTMTGKEDTDYEGYIIAMDNPNDDKTLDSGSKINNLATFKGSNGRKLTFTLPDGIKANRITLYSYTNGSGENESSWYINSTSKTDAIALSKNGVCTSSNPDVRVFTLDDLNSFYINNGGYQQCFYIVIDYIQTVPVTTNCEGGLATFASTKALDLSKLPEGVKAYKVATAAGSSARLEEVTVAVAAGTGLIFKGTKDATYNIPVAESASTLSGNLLVGVTDAAGYTTTSASDAYALSKSDGMLHPVAANVTIPTGKAYLPASYFASNARSISLVFDDETTGIGASLMNSERVNNEVYNLNGQRVMNPAKGLYIVNGKKVVIK